MNEIKKVAEGKNFTAIDAGNLNELHDKLFLKDAVGASATEISLSVIPPGGEIPFFHTHKKNEEAYIILSGEGDFQVDDDSFPIKNGSVVRVATHGKRNMRNTSAEPMRYIVVQAREGSLEEYSGADGELVEQEKRWRF